MPRRILFAQNKSRFSLWVRLGLLVGGLASLGLVVAKINAPTDPALDRSIDQQIAREVALPVPAEQPRQADAELSALTTDPKSSTAAESAPDDTASASEKTLEMVIKRGDNLSTVFARAGLSAQDVQQVVDLGQPAAPLKALKPGEKISLALTPDHQLLGVDYKVAPDKALSIRKEGDAGLIASEIVLPSESRLVTAEGKIESSLYQSALDAGVPAAMVMQLADIFGWKINFLKDVQPGDQFRIVYAEQWVQGKRVGTGHVMAAEFTNQGKTFQALRYTTPTGVTGYYEPNGASLERGFLRYPVEFSRISSKFGMRMHPLFHHLKQHNGVDFAAPTGTPIHAAGAGKVTFIGWQHGYGKVIKLAHEGNFQTVYGHMSGFNRRLKTGSTVAMGEVIGYVGMTGDATGPHLHYEFHVKGVYTDPLSAKLPEANPIPSRYRKDFLAQTQPLLDAMAASADAKQASNTPRATD
ncbi:peptidoglycan DD-metalloendopeptidase family protein [Halothiobacillus sp. DCM-1]|uniref:M23 family metallopeptidase n=1 Tax=Halothiobacillus sp. DCM-1 TaxID=3112558 RepID=UPI00324A83E5